MAKINNKCFGYVLPVSVPDSVEDFDKLAGKPGAALSEAVKNILYRSWNNEFRKQFCERIEKETQVKWPVDQKKTDAQKPKEDGTKTEIHITEGEYFDLVLSSGYTREQFNEIAVEIANGVTFDPSEGERGGGRVGKEYLASADVLLAEPDETLARKLAKLVALNPGLVIENDGVDANDKPTGKPSRETLGKAIKVNADRKAREALAELGE